MGLSVYTTLNMNAKAIPFYLKITVILFGLILIVYILDELSGILIPLAFAGLLSILLNPLFNFICRRKIPRAISVLVTVCIEMACIAGIFDLIGTQDALFSDALPALKVKLKALIDRPETWVNLKFGIT